MGMCCSRIGYCRVACDNEPSRAEGRLRRISIVAIESGFAFNRLPKACKADRETKTVIYIEHPDEFRPSHRASHLSQDCEYKWSASLAVNRRTFAKAILDFVAVSVRNM